MDCKRKLCPNNRETCRPFVRFTGCSALILLARFISRKGSLYEATVSKLGSDKRLLTKGRLWENKQNWGCALSKHIFYFSVKKSLAESVLENCMAQTFLNPFNPSQRAPLIVALFFCCCPTVWLPVYAPDKHWAMQMLLGFPAFSTMQPANACVRDAVMRHKQPGEVTLSYPLL